MDYAIYRKDKKIGNAAVETKGLYYHISCRCTGNSSGHLRLGVSCGDRKVNLGICIPENNVLKINTTVPIKRLGEGELHFYVLEECLQSTNWIELKPNEEFPYLSRLEQARLEVRQGITGVRLLH